MPQQEPPPIPYLSPRLRQQALRQALAQTSGLPPIALRYRRLSTKEQKEAGVSFPLQEQEATDYILRQGWDVGPLFEDTLTGSRSDRPGYQALLAECRRLAAQGRTGMVVVIRLDRFGRSVMERARARNELTNLGITVHSTREGGAVQPLTDGVLAVLAEHFLRELSEKVSGAAAFIISHGWLYPGVLPLGYCWRPATEAERAEDSPTVVADVDPETAPLVVEAFTRASTGEPGRMVARWLHGKLEGASTPSAVQATYGLTARLLRSPLYIARHPSTLPRRKDGEADWATVLAAPAGRWPALVTDEVWLKAQQYRAGRRTHTVPLPVPDGARGYPLTGYLHCPECGGPMHGELTRQKHHGARVGDKEYILYRYRCASRMVKAGHTRACAATVSAARVEQAVATELAPLVEVANTLAERPTVRAELRRAIAQEVERREAAARLAGSGDGAADAAKAAQLDQTIRELETLAGGLNRKFGLDQMPYEEYRQTLATVRTEQQAIRDALEAVQARMALSGVVRPALAGADQIDAMLGRWQVIRQDGGPQGLASDLPGLANAVRLLVQPSGITTTGTGGGKRAGRSVVYRVSLSLTADGEALRAWRPAVLSG